VDKKENGQRAEGFYLISARPLFLLRRVLQRTANTFAMCSKTNLLTKKMRKSLLFFPQTTTLMIFFVQDKRVVSL